jgi:GT2 family glycosyltransferase
VHIVDTSKHSTISSQGFELIKLPPKTNFAHAIDAAVQKLPKDGYLWILHDDSAPDADALEKLLHEVELSPSLAVVGPKQVDWDNPKIIRQLGLTLTNSGRLFSPINTVRGFSVNTLSIGKVGDSFGMSNITIAFNELATISESDITFGTV